MKKPEQTLTPEQIKRLTAQLERIKRHLENFKRMLDETDESEPSPR